MSHIGHVIVNAIPVLVPEIATEEDPVPDPRTTRGEDTGVTGEPGGTIPNSPVVPYEDVRVLLQEDVPVPREGDLGVPFAVGLGLLPLDAGLDPLLHAVGLEHLPLGAGPDPLPTAGLVVLGGVDHAVLVIVRRIGLPLDRGPLLPRGEGRGRESVLHLEHLILQVQFEGVYVCVIFYFSVCFGVVV